MRSLAFVLLALFSLCFRVFSQDEETVLPLAFAVETESSFDVHLIDALSENELFVLEGSCPFAISPDREWLSYSPYSPFLYELHAFNLLTEESILIGDNVLIHQWSTDSRHLAYTRSEEDLRSLFVYDFARQTNTLVYTGLFYLLNFQGDTLYYAALVGEQIGVIRWDGSEELLYTVDGRSDSIPFSISLSPNRQYLAAQYDDGGLYLYDLSEEQLLPFGDLGLVHWRPSEAASFAYSFGDSTAIYNMLTDEDITLEGLTGGDLSWSPDGRYLLETDNEEMKSLRVLSVNSQELLELGIYENWDSFALDWLSDTQFYYSPPLGENGERDYFLHDMLTGEERPITTTPSVYENHGCPIG